MSCHFNDGIDFSYATNDIQQLNVHYVSIQKLHIIYQAKTAIGVHCGLYGVLKPSYIRRRLYISLLVLHFYFMENVKCVRLCFKIFFLFCLWRKPDRSLKLNTQKTPKSIHNNIGFHTIGDRYIQNVCVYVTRSILLTAILFPSDQQISHEWSHCFITLFVLSIFVNSVGQSVVPFSRDLSYTFVHYLLFPITKIVILSSFPSSKWDKI